MVNKHQLIDWLDTYLQNDQFNDKSKNGLQVDTQKDTITKIGYGVDSVSYLFEAAAAEQVDMLIVHHGLFRGYEQPITGVMYERIKTLLDNDIALYASHLPLDAHSEVGNNIGMIRQWCQLFDWDPKKIERFGLYDGEEVGYGVRSKTGIAVNEVTATYSKQLGLKDEFYNFGNHETINAVAIVTGAAGRDMITEADEKNYDLFVTGEMKHGETTYAKELGQSVLLGGHYETETIGVELLANRLKDEYDLETVFVDEGYSSGSVAR